MVNRWLSSWRVLCRRYHLIIALIRKHHTKRYNLTQTREKKQQQQHTQWRKLNYDSFSIVWTRLIMLPLMILSSIRPDFYRIARIFLFLTRIKCDVFRSIEQFEYAVVADFAVAVAIATAVVGATAAAAGCSKR